MTFAPSKRPWIERLAKSGKLTSWMWAMSLKELAARLGVSEKWLGEVVSELARAKQVHPPPSRFWNLVVRVGYESACFAFGVMPTWPALPRYALDPERSTLAEARRWLATLAGEKRPVACPCCGQPVRRSMYVPPVVDEVPSCPPPPDP